MLFILYINDISSVVNSPIKIFADDVTLYSSVQSNKDRTALQADLDSISLWCNQWQMNMNPLKCEVLYITNKHSFTSFDYQLTECSLRWSTSVKYLGAHLNSKLVWNDHCTHVAAKATKLFNFLHQHLYSCSPAAKCRAFRSLVIPILEYASQVWNPHTQKYISQLEAIQLCAAHWIYGSRFNHNTLK